MKGIREELEEAVQSALSTLLGPDAAPVDPVVRPTQDPKFGDYQSAVALGLARPLGKNPRQVAAELLECLELPAGYAPPEIAGPGFLNFRVLPEWLSSRLTHIQADERLGVETAVPRRIVVDFSSPNLAKEMHVGHLRSTIIGDALSRVLEFQGHDVLRLNHVGDWGTQFGMLIQHVRETTPEVLSRPEALQLDDLEAFYRAAKVRQDSDPAFAERARLAVVDLQSGDETTVRVWRVICGTSLRHCHEVLDRLGVRITDRGESFYNDDLPGIVADLKSMGQGEESQGAYCLFLDGFNGPDGNPVPMIVQKEDGGFGYAATDLAAVRHRVNVERASQILYVVDIRQSQHFQMLFQAVRRLGWAPPEVDLQHIGFGMVLGEDKKPYKTRSGDTVKLKALLDEAQARAAETARQAAESRGDLQWWEALSPTERDRVAAVIGIGAVKYADLSHNLAMDYVFDWDTMLALQGNTSVYLQYAYARVRSIGRRAGVDFDTLPTDLPLLVEHESEIGLAKQLLLFGPTVRQVARELRPHLLCDYLYALARAFSTFYDRERGVRVVDAEPEAVRLSRLRLCDLTARTLQAGLGLLGIEVLEKM